MQIDNIADDNIQVFTSPQFGEIRTILIDNDPWFVGKDVAERLGYEKARNAIAVHIDDEDKKVAPIQGDLGGTQQTIIINESGLYSLVLRSNLPTAQQLKVSVSARQAAKMRQGDWSCISQTWRGGDWQIVEVLNDVFSIIPRGDFALSTDLLRAFCDSISATRK